ncbi:uncharacterized protein LOC117936453 isoform X3 [Etheostoma cragini]|uniref:uncharacterized protein LOC117936453 isoform X3 n=1 Tax=Etheostoma cragini TaxID=417921 RepID=UPI00155DE9C1|nr:uncharacterized protein LOC117936453 isoform X3 [Etheostoma cragini]
MAETPGKRPRVFSVSDCTSKKRPTRLAQGPKSGKKRDKSRRKTRVTIGVAFPIWRALKKDKGLRSDTDVALLLLNSYLRKSPDQPTIEESSSTESSESVHEEMMWSQNEVMQETCSAPFVQSSENGKESGKKDTACQRPKSQEEWTTTDQVENNANRDIQEDENEEFSTSLSVGDGRYLVDLGSSSEFIVDEECILQLFKSCRECNRQCTVRKRVTGLKLVVNQACCFCQSHSKWTNLPDDDDDDLQTNGKQTAHKQTNSAKQ